MKANMLYKSVSDLILESPTYDFDRNIKSWVLSVYGIVPTFLLLLLVEFHKAHPSYRAMIYKRMRDKQTNLFDTIVNYKD